MSRGLREGTGEILVAPGLRLRASHQWSTLQDIVIGDFEYRVLAAIAQLGDEAYGASLRRLLSESGKTPSVGALYTTLDRLQAKGLIESWMGESTPERGGRAKRMVRLTPEGAREARAFYEAIMHASRNVSWAGLP